MRRRSVLGTLLPLLLTPLLAGCGDDIFGEVPWVADQDTAVIYALSRPELGLPSGFDFLGRAAIRIEAVTATGRWDVALDREGSELVLLAPGALGVSSQARIATFPNSTFEEVREAPGDSADYSILEPVPVREGSIYVVRTRRRTGSFGRVCVHYAKLSPIEVDVQVGSLRFFYDVNPRCSDRGLIPPDS